MMIACSSDCNKELILCRMDYNHGPFVAERRTLDISRMEGTLDSRNDS